MSSDIQYQDYKIREKKREANTGKLDDTEKFQGRDEANADHIF